MRPIGGLLHEGHPPADRMETLAKQRLNSQKRERTDFRIIRARLRLVRAVLVSSIVLALLTWQIKIEVAPVTKSRLFGHGTIFSIGGIEYHGTFSIKGCGPRLINGKGGSYAWVNVSFIVQGQVDDAQGLDTSDPSLPWKAIAIDPPFHLRLERADYSQSDPVEVVWSDPFSPVAAWSNDGRRIKHLWWDGRELRLGPQLVFAGAVWAVVRVILFVSFFAALPVLVVWRLTAERRWIRVSINQCLACGYDCRLVDTSKCPECGWERPRQ